MYVNEGKSREKCRYRDMMTNTGASKERFFCNVTTDAKKE